jgi:hypothetical protein
MDEYHVLALPRYNVQMIIKRSRTHWDVHVEPSATMDSLTRARLCDVLDVLDSSSDSESESTSASCKIVKLVALVLPRPRALTRRGRYADDGGDDIEDVHISMFQNHARIAFSQGRLRGVDESVFRGVGAATMCRFFEFLLERGVVTLRTRVGLEASGSLTSSEGERDINLSPLARYYNRTFGFRSLVTEVDVLDDATVYEDYVPMISTVEDILDACRSATTERPSLRSRSRLRSRLRGRLRSRSRSRSRLPAKRGRSAAKRR